MVENDFIDDVEEKMIAKLTKYWPIWALAYKLGRHVGVQSTSIVTPIWAPGTAISGKQNSQDNIEALKVPDLNAFEEEIKAEST